MTSRSVRIWIKLMNCGHYMGCHQLESRSMHFRGYQFPLCARCTGVLLGQIATIIAIIAGFRLDLFSSGILLGTMGADWLLQWLEIRMSTNLRRFLTGICGGIGLTYIWFFAICEIVKLCKV